MAIGRRAPFTVTVVGDLSANALQMTVAAFGLTAVIFALSDALTVVKWLGVCYLAWIGLRLPFARGQHERPHHAPLARNRRVPFQQGFITSSANPYAVVFFGALFPQFIDPALPVWPQLAILGAPYLLVDALTLVLWGWSSVEKVGGMRRLSGAWVNRISGGLMILGAAYLALRDLAAEANR